MAAFCVITNNHLNSFYGGYCAINMDDRHRYIGVKVVLPRASSDSTWTPISGSCHAILTAHTLHKNGFSTPLRSLRNLRGFRVRYSHHTHILTFVRMFYPAFLRCVGSAFLRLRRRRSYGCAPGGICHAVIAARLSPCSRSLIGISRHRHRDAD